MQTFRDVIELWPSPSCVTLAKDLQTTEGRVRKWHGRNRVPGDWWQPMVMAAKRRDILLSLDDLGQLGARTNGTGAG